MSKLDREQIEEQIRYIEDKCAQYGIPPSDDVRLSGLRHQRGRHCPTPGTGLPLCASRRRPALPAGHIRPDDGPELLDQPQNRAHAGLCPPSSRSLSGGGRSSSLPARGARSRTRFRQHVAQRVPEDPEIPEKATLPGYSAPGPAMNGKNHKTEEQIRKKWATQS